MEQLKLLPPSNSKGFAHTFPYQILTNERSSLANEIFVMMPSMISTSVPLALNSICFLRDVLSNSTNTVASQAFAMRAR
jgi:hypothetical protein